MESAAAYRKRAEFIGYVVPGQWPGDWRACCGYCADRRGGMIHRTFRTTDDNPLYCTDCGEMLPSMKKSEIEAL